MKRQQRKLIFAAANITLAILIAVAAFNPPVTHALPTYARQYNTPCKTCHTVAPRLNKTGLAFQANYRNWPGGYPKHLPTGWNAVPISALMGSTWGNSQGGPTGAQFQSLELYATGGFAPYTGRGGGYWVDDLVASNNGTRPGYLDGAWVACPIAGSAGQLAVRIGQFTMVDYQCDGIGTLVNTLPLALNDPIDGQAMDASTPSVALEYFDHRGRRTADGDYVDAGIPFAGHITLNQDSRLYGPHGIYIHAFRRQGYKTDGAFAYRDGSSTQEGVIETRQISPDLTVLGIAATGGDTGASVGGNQSHLSIEGDYTISTDLALSGQFNAVRGVDARNFPVGTVTWYPAHQRILRITGETVQDPGNRSNTAFAFVQF